MGRQDEGDEGSQVGQGFSKPRHKNGSLYKFPGMFSHISCLINAPFHGEQPPMGKDRKGYHIA